MKVGLPYHGDSRKPNLRKNLFISINLLLLLVLLSGCTLQSSEEQEYARITSPLERQSFQQSVEDLRSKGFDVNFGRQPPYYNSSDRRVYLKNNVAAVNPTWQQLMDFLKADQTDSHSYIPDVYECAEFAENLHNAAEKAGIRSAFVAVDFVDDTTGHGLDAFFTVDLGWVFVDNTGPGLFEKFSLDPLLSDHSQRHDPFADWSHDSVAYVQIGQELAFIHILLVESFDYAYYEDWSIKYQFLKTRFEQYNNEVKSFNDWVSSRVFYHGTPEALRLVTWEEELDAQKEALESDELMLGPFYETMGVVKDVNIYF